MNANGVREMQEKPRGTIRTLGYLDQRSSGIMLNVTSEEREPLKV